MPLISGAESFFLFFLFVVGKLEVFISLFQRVVHQKRERECVYVFVCVCVMYLLHCFERELSVCFVDIYISYSQTGYSHLARNVGVLKLRP